MEARGDEQLGQGEAACPACGRPDVVAENGDIEPHNVYGLASRCDSREEILMPATTTASSERVNHGVVWGPEEHERINYIDYGDGSFISTTAEIRAVRKYIEMVNYGVRVGIFRNGVLEGGVEPIWPDEEV